MKMQFYRDCVCWPHNKIGELYDLISLNREITRTTFLKHVDREEFREIEANLGYDTMPWHKGGLRMKNDWAVTYHRSKLNGRVCYYFRHSAIEYVFTEEDNNESIYFHRTGNW